MPAGLPANRSTSPEGFGESVHADSGLDQPWWNCFRLVVAFAMLNAKRLIALGEAAAIRFRDEAIQA
jgi:hypothetical protein